MIDLDALLGETGDRQLVYKGETFTLPSEIPGECLAPFLAEDLGLLELLANAFKDDNDEKSAVDLVFDALRAQPRLPVKVLDAIKESFRILLGDSYEPFIAKRPGINAYLALARGLVDEYGLALTDFFGSSESSENGGTNSKETSPTTTPDSTPETSGDTPTTPDAPVSG